MGERGRGRGGPFLQPYEVNSSNQGSAKGFTLIELLVVLAVIALLAALLLPALARSKAAAWRADCTSHLRQLGLAAQMYWDDHAGRCFRWSYGPKGATNGGQTYWFGWIGSGPEGVRTFDLSPGALYPYLRGSAVRLCPALNYALAQFKLKADSPVCSFGYNFYLSPPNDQSQVFISRVARPTVTVLFADAAQVNDFQAPAGPDNPMLEEWYYVDTTTNYGAGYYPNGHFRHSKKANAVFCDSHVGQERMAPGSLDQRLPNQSVGTIRQELLVLP